MTARWSYAETPSGEFVPNSLLKTILCRPIRTLLVFFGIMLVVASIQAHAYSPVSASLSPSEVWLQPGTEITGTISVSIPYQPTGNAKISFLTQSPEGITIDGELSPIQTPFSLERDVVIRASPFVKEGDYFATIEVRTLLDSQLFTNTIPILIHIGPKSHFIYSTSDYSTLPPSIGNVVISPSSLSLPRGENGSIAVSFIHFGSPTDYLIRLSQPSLDVSVDIPNPSFHFVENGKIISVNVNIKATPHSTFGNTALSFEAYDLATGQKTPLGGVIVHVPKITHFTSSLPARTFIIEDGNVFSSVLTIQNTEYSDADIVLESQTSLIQFPSRFVHVPAKSSADVPFSILPGIVNTSRVEIIYLTTSDYSDQVSFSVQTIPLKTIHSDSNSFLNGFSSTTGLVSGTVSSVGGMIIILFALLVIVSKKVRDKIHGILPKSAAPVAPTKEN